MNLIQKIATFQIGWLDVGMTKIAVVGATLFVAKLWSPILSLDWYWYLILLVVAGIKPLLTLCRWLAKPEPAPGR